MLYEVITMFDTLIPQFEKQLDGRKALAQRALLLQAALSTAVMLLVAYFGIGTYYSVVGTVEVVITSYSIHYTKLYEPSISAAMSSMRRA